MNTIEWPLTEMYILISVHVTLCLSTVFLSPEFQAYLPLTKFLFARMCE